MKVTWFGHSKFRLRSSFWIIIEALLLLPDAWARPRVALLTSIATNGEGATAELARAEFEFTDAFRENYELVTQVLANQRDLFQVLTDPTVKGVIWVSHSSAGQCAPDQLGLHPMILDYLGFDVSPIFRTVRPHLRFLGVVGCHSFLALSRIHQVENWELKYPDLQIQGFQGQIELLSGLRAVISEGKKHLLPAQVSAPDEHSRTLEPGLKVRIERDIEQEDGDKNLLAPSARVLLGRTILGVFPSSVKKELQWLDLELPSELASTPFQLVVELGANAKPPADLNLSLGAFRIRSSDFKDGRWSQKQSRSKAALNWLPF